MITGRFQYISLFILFAISHSCMQKESLRYYSSDDFKSVRKIDMHFHLNTDDTVFIGQLSEDNFRILDIVDDRPFGLSMFEQQEIALIQNSKNPDQLAFATTFSVKEWDNPDWQEQTVSYLKNSIDKGAIAVKVWKNIGMDLKGINGKFVMVDDPEFDVVFDFLADYSSIGIP